MQSTFMTGQHGGYFSLKALGPQCPPQGFDRTSLWSKVDVGCFAVVPTPSLGPNGKLKHNSSR